MLFSTEDTSNPSNFPSIKAEEAKIGQNVFPAVFDKDQVMSNIDPVTNLKKEQNLEFKELPQDGKHDPTTYHVMKSLKPFKDTSNDISREYGVKVKGLEPTRFGDWERKGRCTDF
jgi:hypothetical protein